jgi:hypothetical protein
MQRKNVYNNNLLNQMKNDIVFELWSNIQMLIQIIPFYVPIYEHIIKL